MTPTEQLLDNVAKIQAKLDWVKSAKIDHVGVLIEGVEAESVMGEILRLAEEGVGIAQQVVTQEPRSMNSGQP